VLALAHGAWAPALGDVRFWLLAALVLVGELLPIRFPVRDRYDDVTMSATFAVAVLVAFGAGPALAVYALASLVADLRDRASAMNVLFNVAQYTISLGSGAAVLAILDAPAPVSDVTVVLPQVLAAVLVVFAVNHGLAGSAAALFGGQAVLSYLRRSATLHAWTDGFLIVLAPVVVAAAGASPWLVPLLLFPMLASYLGGKQALLSNHRALHDQLTDLPNRVLLGRRVDDAVADARRCDTRVAVMLVDLDDFKAVNKTLGHSRGDVLLRMIAPRLAAVLDPGDTLARLGGDDFAVVRTGIRDAADAHRTAAMVLEALDAPFEMDGLDLDARASLGLAIYPDHGASAEVLLSHADVALSRAKEDGTVIEIYAAEHDDYSLDRLVLAGQLRRGIARGELVLHYQPKVSLRDGRPQGVEALVRWDHPQLGLLMPGGFIPLAEHTGLIASLTEWVIDSAVRQCAAWRRAGLQVQMSVNLSARTLLNDDLPERVGVLLAGWDLPPQALKLEITESKIVADLRRARRVLGRLHGMGVEGAIDDFGTGYSSLAQLQQLPVTEIKVDQAFVRRMDVQPNDAAIVRSTIELGRNLGLMVTAEGVENEAVRVQLRGMGCDLAQGYHVCPPVPADVCGRALRAALDASSAGLAALPRDPQARNVGHGSPTGRFRHHE
jgi:diguanylate cyclase (GGDEF)-like protein